MSKTVAICCLVILVLATADASGRDQYIPGRGRPTCKDIRCPTGYRCSTYAPCGRNNCPDVAARCIKITPGIIRPQGEHYRY